MKTTLIACLMCLTIAVLPAALPATTSAPSRAATIVSWTDGDTVRVRIGASADSVQVRLIGIDAPETRAGERAAKQAVSLGVDSAAIVKMGRFARDTALRLAPPGTAVRVELDVQSHDRYGRLLAYLWLQNGRMVNEELVRLGYAMVLTIPPNVRYVARFTAAQADARRNRRGLWGDASPSVAVLALVPQPTPGSPPTPDPLPRPPRRRRRPSGQGPPRPRPLAPPTQAWLRHAGPATQPGRSRRSTWS